MYLSALLAAQGTGDWMRLFGGIPSPISLECVDFTSLPLLVHERESIDCPATFRSPNLRIYRIIGSELADS